MFNQLKNTNEKDHRTLEFDTSSYPADTLKKLKALASEPRMRILQRLGGRICNLTELAKDLDMNLSTLTLHINQLEDAGLIICEHKPGERGTQKVCTRLFSEINIQFEDKPKKKENDIEFRIPLGAYTDVNVHPTCGLTSEKQLIGMMDNPESFYEPERNEAQLIWFHWGHIEYRVPNRLPPKAKLASLQLSAELCSEAPTHHAQWPSDISVWINDVEIGTWTSPSDFGGQRGKLTPSWWSTGSTQYGLLKIWQVTPEGSFIDGMRLSGVTLDDLNIHDSSVISVRFGVKKDARHVGGINLFGAKFGNYPQDILVRFRYD